MTDPTELTMIAASGAVIDPPPSYKKASTPTESTVTDPTELTMTAASGAVINPPPSYKKAGRPKNSFLILKIEQLRMIEEIKSRIADDCLEITKRAKNKKVRTPKGTLKRLISERTTHLNYNYKISVG